MSESNVQHGAESGNGRPYHVYSNPALDTCSEDTLDNRVIGGSVVNQDNLQQKNVVKDFGSWLKEKSKRFFTKKTLYKRVPIVNWLPKYNLEWAIGDLLAGITVGLTVIPQALAFANIAGLPPQYGLYGSFLGCFIYIIFGSCKDVPIGPTAIASLLTYQATSAYGEYAIYYAILLTFLSGVVELAMGLLGLGFIIDFISGPVSSGFTSAVALIIVTSQVKDILGIVVKGNTFLEMWISIFENIQDTRLWDPIMGGVCLVILLLMTKLAFIKVGPKEPSLMENEKLPIDTEVPKTWHKVVNKALWLISTARNAILVIVGGFVGKAVYDAETQTTPMKLIGYVPEGLPEVKLPPFSYDTDNGTVGFAEITSNLGASIAVVPLIALLENMALCKAFASGKPVDATQELIAIGLSNIANSFMQAYPGNGGLARGAVNNKSGVRTPFGGLYTGILVIFALLYFTPYFFYIPKATLAAVIIAAVISMVEVRVIKPMWKSKKSDLIPGLGTFIACLVLPLEYGIISGVGLNLLFILYHAARPKILVERLTSQSDIEYLMLTPDRCLIFPSVDYVRNLVTKHSIRQGIPVVIDCSYIYGADFTAAQVVECLTKDFTTRNQPLIFYNLKTSVFAVFEGLAPKEFVVVYTQEQLDELLKQKCESSKDIIAA